MTTCRLLFHCGSCRAKDSRDEMWCFVVRQTDQPKTVGVLTSRHKEAWMFLYKMPPKKSKWSWIKPNFRFLMATIFPFLTGHAVFWRGTFKLLCDVMSEPRQSGADPSAWQRNIISHRVNASLYGSRNGTKFYMKSQLKSFLTFQILETWEYM